jgi:hypothetical protein
MISDLSADDTLEDRDALAEIDGDSGPQAPKPQAPKESTCAMLTIH